MRVKVAPSILSVDFGKLNEEIKSIEPYSDMLHIDVMDGHFVPNITIGPVVVKNIKTKLKKECHLMISDPVKYAKDFAPFCDRISFHAELFDEKSLVKAIDEIKKLDVQVGLSINPDKPVSLLLPVLDKLDFVLIMSVYAGFGGQEFIPDVLDKVRFLREQDFLKDIEIDGGINLETAKLAVEAGVNVLISGSYIFNNKNRKQAIERLRK